MKIAVFGATGYTGGYLTDEAVRRGHEVVAVSRSGDPVVGAITRRGSIFDAAFLESIATEVDVVAVAVPAESPAGSLAELVPVLLDSAARHAARVAVVGGAGSLLIAPGGPALYDSPGFPEAFRPGSKAQGVVLDALQAGPGDADWFYLSPAGEYGKRNPGERTGVYRTAEDELITDVNGTSYISGADYAVAFLDEIENPKHSRARFTVAY